MSTDHIPFWMAVAMGAASVFALPMLLIAGQAVVRLCRRWRRRLYEGPALHRGP